MKNNKLENLVGVKNINKIWFYDEGSIYYIEGKTGKKLIGDLSIFDKKLKEKEIGFIKFSKTGKVKDYY